MPPQAPTPSSRWRIRLRPVVVPALDGLRMYPRSALLIGALGTAALATSLPVLLLATWRDGSLLTRLLPDPDPGAPLIGPYAQPASALQLRAIVTFFRILCGMATATLFVAALAALGLSAARASQRTVELGVRRAIGASRWMLLGGLGLEGLLLGATVLLLGAGVGGGAADSATGTWPGPTATATPFVALAAAAGLLSFLVAGVLLPVIFARREPLGAPTPRPVPLFIPALQLGASLIVLGAGLQLSRQAGRLLDPGSASVPRGAVYPIATTDTAPAAIAVRYQLLLSRLKSGAESLSLASPGAALGSGPVNRITTDCGSCFDGGLPLRYHRATVTQQIVSADSFHALGTGLVAGRGFSSADSLGSPLVAVVSRSLAERHFEPGGAVGRRFRLQRGEPAGSEAEEWYTVVGVVEDRRSERFGGGAQPTMAIYLNLMQHPLRRAELLVTEVPDRPSPAAIELAIRESFGADAARGAPVSTRELLAREAERFGWFAAWFARLGWVMLLIAALGTFTLMRAWVVSLRAELGLRRAVGARRDQLLLLVLGRAAGVGLAGAGLGLWFGPAIWGALGEMIGGRGMASAPPMAGLVVLLVLTTLAGAMVPGWGAARRSAAELLGSSGE